jgi:hypothetical protein
MEVYKAIAAVQGEMAEIGIKKDKKNQQQGYSFRGIDDVYNALAPLLSKHGLCILPRVTERTVVERQTKSGGALFYTTVKCEFDFVSAVDGSKHTVVTYGEAMDSGDKSMNKAMSASYKYAAFQAFCIPVDVEDADKTTHEVASNKMEKPPPKNTEPDVPEPEQLGTGPVNAAQKKVLAGLMKQHGLTTEEQKTFYNYVNPKDYAAAQFFIEDFAGYLRTYTATDVVQPEQK